MLRASIVIPIVRPEGANICMQACVKNAGIPMDEYEFICAEDVDRDGCPKMVKYLTENTNSDIVIFLGDDTIPEKDWLKEGLKVMDSFEDGWGLVKINDHQNTPWAQHFMIHKRLIDKLTNKEIFSTQFWHSACDEWLYIQANRFNRFKYAEKSCIIHDHPTGTIEAKKRYGQVYSRQWQMHDKWVLEEFKNNGGKSFNDPSFNFNRCLYNNEVISE